MGDDGTGCFGAIAPLTIVLSAVVDQVFEPQPVRLPARWHLHRAGFADIFANGAAYARLWGVEALLEPVGKFLNLLPNLILRSGSL